MKNTQGLAAAPFLGLDRHKEANRRIAELQRSAEARQAAGKPQCSRSAGRVR